MFNKKCRGCGEKVERKFNYCPWCGAGLKAGAKRDSGMIGSSDVGNLFQGEAKLPFGLNKMVGSLVKQLEKEMGNMDLGNVRGVPKGFKIQIGGKMPNGVIPQKVEAKKKIENVIVSEAEGKRRRKLKKVDAISKVKRFGDLIVYEIEAPGVMDKKDVVISELESGLEIRAYSKDVCYVKVIPLKVEVLRWAVKGEKVLVEMKG
ncbi:hypothetical protein HNV12_02915 [Methanococcoides sp. SA1]|nr:hypothetical protein [Methanococcoides sp. SA1]